MAKFEKNTGRKEKQVARRTAKVIWGYHMIIQKATRETPFSKAYGTKALISVQVTTMPNLHIEERTSLENVGVLNTNLDFADEH